MTLTGFQIGAPGYGNISYGSYPSAGLPVTNWGAVAQSAQIPADPYGSFGIDTAGTFDSVGSYLSSNPLPRNQSGFLDYLNTFGDLLRGGADAFRAAKGLPTRFDREDQQRLAGLEFGKYLEDRRAEREERRQQREMKPTSVGEDKAFNLSILRKALSSPAALQELVGEAVVTPSIDPTGFGVTMDVTPARQWRPQTPSAQR
jgi:hypothetical protein